MKKKILITGAAGFIGSALAERLAGSGHEIIGIDNLNNYYDPRLKEARLKKNGIDLSGFGTVRATPCAGNDRSEVEFHMPPEWMKLQSELWPGLSFERADITDLKSMERIFAEERPEVVINLAAQAGVRYSLENPLSYVHTNVVGFVNLLECCRRNPVKHFVYASSSSVYGGNTKSPFSEDDRVDSPVSLYAATKKSDELMAEVYRHLYGVPCTGLRFFTVYGPWGRPDMAPMLFSDAISKGAPIKVFNSGKMSRDFTYIDDIVEGVVRVAESEPSASEQRRVYNIGCGHPETLEEFISLIEKGLGKKAARTLLPMQPGDVETTWADTTALERDYGYLPEISLEEGISRFTRWYKERFLAP